MTTTAMSSSPTMPGLQQQQKLNPQQQQHMIQLLQASIRCVHSGMFHPVLYQTLGALHQYVALHAGFATAGTSSSSPLLASSRPAFYVVKNGTNDEEQEKTKETHVEKKNHGDNDSDDHEDSGGDDDDEDVLAYGWVRLLSTSQGDDDDEQVEEPTWKSVLALLAQKDNEDEPCLWITREVLATSEHASSTNNRKKWRPSTTLETLHSIPLLRRLQSCRYQNFYGDHRVVLKLRHHHSPLVLQCPTSQDAQNWVQQVQWRKQQHAGLLNNNDIPSNNNIELEMIDTFDSQEQQPKEHVVNVIVQDELYRGESMSSLPGGTSPDKGTQKRLAEQLQEAEDMKRAQKEAQELAERERKLEQEEEKLERQQLEAKASATPRKDLRGLNENKKLEDAGRRPVDEKSWNTSEKN